MGIFAVVVAGLVSLATSHINELSFKLGDISVTCLATHSQESQLKDIYGDFVSVAESETIVQPLPQCTLSKKGAKFTLVGTIQQSKVTVENLKTLLTARFNSRIKASNKEYLKLIGTKFLHLSYVKSVANLCTALKEHKKGLVCAFLDVTTDPMLLVHSQHKVPWVEIKLSTNPEPIFITDPFPTLAGVAERLGIILEAEPSYQKHTVLQCSMYDCGNSRPEEVLLYTGDYWNRGVLPSIEMKVHPEYLADTGIPHTPESVMKVLEGGKLKGDEPDLVSEQNQSRYCFQKISKVTFYTR
eukprot:sb/3467402/